MFSSMNWDKPRNVRKRKKNNLFRVVFIARFGPGNVIFVCGRNIPKVRYHCFRASLLPRIYLVEKENENFFFADITDEGMVD